MQSTRRINNNNQEVVGNQGITMGSSQKTLVTKKNTETDVTTQRSSKKELMSKKEKTDFFTQKAGQEECLFEIASINPQKKLQQ